MIQEKKVERRLFYTCEDIPRPRSGLYARIDGAVGDWHSLTAPLAKCFCQERNGRPTDPAVYLKIFLVGYVERIEDDTVLADRIADSLSIREFLGYGLDEATPDHSSISRVRGRIAASLAEVLGNVVALCADAGLLGGKECAVDSTLIKANASTSSLRHIETGETSIDHVRRLKKEHPESKPKLRSSHFISGSDPDARLATKPSAPPNLYYKATTVTDAKDQIILTVQCSKADVHDTRCAKDPLLRACRKAKFMGLAIEAVVADAGYDDGDFHAFVESLGAVPITNHQRKAEKGFPKSAFFYDSENDSYICPMGEELRRVRSAPERSQYRTARRVCQSCPLKSHCIPKGKVRTISRYPNEEPRSRNLARSATAEGQAALARRKQVAEPPFAHMKRHGLRRVNCRGLLKVDAKAHCAAIAWNLLKLAAGVRSATIGSVTTPWTLLQALFRPFLPHLSARISSAAF